MSALSPEVLAYARLVQKQLDEWKVKGEWSRDDAERQMRFAKHHCTELGIDLVVLTRVGPDAAKNAGLVGLHVMLALDAKKLLEVPRDG